MPSATRLRSGSKTPKSTRSLPLVVLSPPGMTSASTLASSSGRRTSRASAPSFRSVDTCSAKSPWSARTPTLRLTLPAPNRQELALAEGGGVDAAHRLAQTAGDLGDYLGVLEVRRRLDDRGGALGRIVRLEDAGADDDALRGHLHSH